ncbi:MAG TPA: MBL fold metallo-hydrolase [Coriobacteriia bacterium]
MRLTVLGSSASYAGPGQACAGYLVEGGGARVLFDVGNGALANLACVTDPLSLDAVFLSHGHPDHLGDMYALQAMLRYAPEGPAPALTVFAPAGVLDRAAGLLDGHGATEFHQAFDGRDLVAGAPVRIAGLTVTPLAVDHEGSTFALVADADGRRLCYTSDTRYGDAVLAAAAGADLLLAEATLPDAYAGRAPHMTASEAGALASAVGARALVVTHLWPTTHRGEILERAEAAFDGPVTVAVELLSLVV